MAISLQTFTMSGIQQFWEGVTANRSQVAALIGIRRLRMITPADTDLTIDGTNMAIARCLIFSGGTTATLVAADDDPAIVTDGTGGRCAVPLTGGVFLMPVHTRRVVSSDATKVVAGF